MGASVNNWLTWEVSTERKHDALGTAVIRSSLYTAQALFGQGGPQALTG